MPTRGKKQHTNTAHACHVLKLQLAHQKLSRAFLDNYVQGTWQTVQTDAGMSKVFSQHHGEQAVIACKIRDATTVLIPAGECQSLIRDTAVALGAKNIIERRQKALDEDRLDGAFAIAPLQPTPTKHITYKWTASNITTQSMPEWLDQAAAFYQSCNTMLGLPVAKVNDESYMCVLAKFNKKTINLCYYPTSGSFMITGRHSKRVQLLPTVAKLLSSLLNGLHTLTQEVEPDIEAESPLTTTETTTSNTRPYGEEQLLKESLKAPLLKESLKAPLLKESLKAPHTLAQEVEPGIVPEYPLTTNKTAVSNAQPHGEEQLPEESHKARLTSHTRGLTARTLSYASINSTCTTTSSRSTIPLLEAPLSKEYDVSDKTKSTLALLQHTPTTTELPQMEGEAQGVVSSPETHGLSASLTKSMSLIQADNKDEGNARRTSIITAYAAALLHKHKNKTHTEGFLELKMPYTIAVFAKLLDSTNKTGYVNDTAINISKSYITKQMALFKPKYTKFVTDQLKHMPGIVMQALIANTDTTHDYNLHKKTGTTRSAQPTIKRSASHTNMTAPPAAHAHMW